MDSPEQIDEDCVLKTKEGRNAIQYVFSDDEGQSFLEVLAPGSLVAYPVSTAEHLQWYVENNADLLKLLSSTIGGI
jgi:hypothetical protein